MQKGTKRKSIKAMMSESEEGELSDRLSKPPTRSDPKDNVRVKNRTVLSDDDDEETLQLSRKSRITLGKAKAVDSSADREAKALMDVDDGMKPFCALEPSFEHLP